MWLIALLALIVTRQYGVAPNEGLIVIIGLLAASMVMFWMGALDRLARQQAWRWFVGLVVLQLVGLGGIGMAAYAFAGPVDLDLSKPRVSS